MFSVTRYLSLLTGFLAVLSGNFRPPTTGVRACQPLSMFWDSSTVSMARILLTPLGGGKPCAPPRCGLPLCSNSAILRAAGRGPVDCSEVYAAGSNYCDNILLRRFTRTWGVSARGKKNLSLNAYPSRNGNLPRPQGRPSLRPRSSVCSEAASIHFRDPSSLRAGPDFRGRKDPIWQI